MCDGGSDCIYGQIKNILCGRSGYTLLLFSIKVGRVLQLMMFFRLHVSQNEIVLKCVSRPEKKCGVCRAKEDSPKYSINPSLSCFTVYLTSF